MENSAKWNKALNKRGKRKKEKIFSTIVDSIK